MKLYVVVEGEGEAKVYPKWIEVVNPALVRADRVDAIAENGYYLISGQGYPQYMDMIRDAILDIARYPQYDRLVVGVDSEENSLAEKFQEIDEYIKGLRCPVPHRIVVQHFCLETWALGNRRVFHRNPGNPELRKCIEHFDVSAADPQLLTAPADEELTRAKYAFKYLRLLLRERNPRLVYSKRNPMEIAEPHFLKRIVERFEQGRDIQSFAAFPAAFV